MNGTVEAVANDWMKNVVQGTIKPLSYQRKMSTLQNHIYPVIGKLQVSSLKPEDMQSIINDMSQRGMSYSSIKKAYEAINSCLNGLVEQRKLEYNPIRGTKLPKARAKEMSDVHFYTEKELSAICREAMSLNVDGTHKYSAAQLFVLAANTGMRAGEIIPLQWDDIDFDKRLVHVSKNAVLIKENGTYKTIVQSSAKTTSSIRHIPLNNAAIDALNDLKANSSSSSYLFLTRNNNLYTVTNIDKILKHILRNCGFGEANADGTPGKNKLYGIHAFRHSFASALLSKGADIKKVSEILGHKNVTITYNTYIHFIPKDLADTVKLLD